MRVNERKVKREMMVKNHVRMFRQRQKMRGTEKEEKKRMKK